MQVFCMNYSYIFWPRNSNTRPATWTFWSFYAYMTLACAPVLPVPAIYKNSLYMILACVAKCRSSAWIIGKLSGQERPAQEQLHGRSGLFSPIWFWLVCLFYQCQLYIRTAYTSFWLVWPNAGLLHELHFFPETPAQEQLHGLSGIFTPIWFWLVRLFYQCHMYIRTASTWFWLVRPNAGLLHELFIHFFGPERPTQEQLHGRSGLSTRIWLWLVRLFYQCQLYIKTAYTWFWLGWPNAGLPHELLVNFLARKGQHKNSYMDVLVFLHVYDSGLCACSTSASYI